MDYNNNNNKLLVFIFIFVILFFCSIINKSYDFNTTLYKDNTENKNTININNMTVYTKQQIRDLYIDQQINTLVQQIINYDYGVPKITINRNIEMIPTKNFRYTNLEKTCIRIKERLSNIFIDSLVTGKLVNDYGDVVIKNTEQIGYKIYNKPFNYNNKYYCSVTIDWS